MTTSPPRTGSATEPPAPPDVAAPGPNAGSSGPAATAGLTAPAGPSVSANPATPLRTGPVADPGAGSGCGSSGPAATAGLTAPASGPAAPAGLPQRAELSRPTGPSISSDPATSPSLTGPYQPNTAADPTDLPGPPGVAGPAARPAPVGRSGPSGAPASAVPSPTATPLGRVLTVTVLGSVMAVLDMTIVNVALRSLSDAFRAPLTTIQWAATAYSLALAAVIPTAAWAIGRIGARRAYLTALALFTLGSLLAAGAWDAGSLIAFRAVQGLGGGLLMPVGMTMVMRAADPERMGRAMAIGGLPILVGPVLGPTLGGWLVDAASWHWIFLINVPLGALALALAARLLRPDAPRAGDPAPPRLDVPGLLTLSPGLALLLYGLARGGEAGNFTALEAWLPAAAGVLLVAGFVRRALTAREPLLDLRLLRDRTFAAGIGTLALFTCGYFGSMLLGPVYWQAARGFTASSTGLLAMPVGLTVGLTMQIAARRIDSVAPRRLIPAGVAVAALGMGMSALQTGIPDVAVWRPVAAAMLMGVGAGIVMMPTMTTASRDLPRHRLAAASTALSIDSQLGAAVGTALCSVLLASAGTDPAGFRLTYAVAAGLLTLAVLPALFLPGRRAELPR
ncbi:DHA2 family efflux MFS transporter permease subunit [Streptomyces sp. NPDC048623]|uniref:DHA2 family efflux MFS transporter permease subunit n=1 Tax=Streptomyces sp. NPDC048623 TaxID=3155761 RepID=UPI00341549A8